MDNGVVEKTVYDKLATKVNATDTSTFTLKTQYNTDKLSTEKESDDAGNKILATTQLV